MASSRRSGTNEAVFTFGASGDYRTSGGFGTVATWESDAGTADLTTGMSKVAVSNNSAGRFRLGEALAFSASEATATCFGQSADRAILYYKVTSGTPTTDDTVTGGTTSATCDIDSITSTNTGVSLVLECAAGSYAVSTITFAGCTTSTTYCRIVRASSTARHGGVIGAGVVFTTSGTNQATFYINEGYFRLQDIESVSTSNTSGDVYNILLGTSSGGCEVVGCLLSSSNAGAGASRGLSGYNDASNRIIANCIAYGAKTSGFLTRNTSTRILNCTACGCVTGFDYFSSIPIWINCLAQDNTTADFNGTGTTGSQNNLSKDTTATGTNSITETDLTLDANYHLVAADTAAIGAGADLHADATWAFNDDIAYTSRPDGAWDIGAWEYVSAVTDIAKTPTDGSVAITGKASVRLVNDARQPLPVNAGVALTAVAGARLVNHIRTPLVG